MSASPLDPTPLRSAWQGEPPPLAPDASAEEKDRHWYTYVYQGDRVPQLTARALIMGAILGMLMATSNLYTVLKLGWSFGVGVTSCVLSYVIWNALRALSVGRLTPMSILENNCMQSTASSAGAATGTTIATCFGALLILDPAHHHVAWPVVAAFTVTTGIMGVLLAVPTKRQLINYEQLPFPSATAVATTLKSLYAHGTEAMHKAYALIAALGVGAIVGVLNTPEDQFVALGHFFTWMRVRIVNIHMPDLVPAAGIRLLAGKPMVAFGFEPSGLLIAAGMIIGLRGSLSMFATSGALYFFLAPWLQSIDAAHAGVAGYVASIPTVAGGTMFHPMRWSLWGGASIMVFAGLTSLAFQWPTILRAFRALRRSNAPEPPKGSMEDIMAGIEIPGRWVVIGVIPIGLALVALQIIAFHIQWWAGLIAVGMSFVLVLVACRAVGETDTNPIGAMGKVMQLLFAVISPGNTTHNVVSAGVGANSAAASAELLSDLKAGYLLGNNPRKQFVAQLTGVLFGTLAVVPAWYLMIPNISALDKYPLPATQVWVAVARVLSAGVDSLPMSVRILILVGALIGIGVPLLERLVPRARPWLPSVMGLGLGWVIFFSNALSFAIGSIIGWLWRRFHPRSEKTYLLPIASGLIAGESILKALLAMLATAIGLAS